MALKNMISEQRSAQNVEVRSGIMDIIVYIKRKRTMTKFAGYIKRYGAIPKLLTAGILSYITLGIFYGKGLSHIASIDRTAHEIGHIISSPFGDTSYLLGGSLMQIILPCALLYYFCKKKKSYFASGVMLWWIGENLTNISAHLHNISADKDLIELLTQWNALTHTELIGNLFWHLGIMTLLTGLMWTLMYSYKKMKVPSETVTSN